MSTIYLVRHGESEWNANGNRYCGLTDIRLSKRGREQARLAASLLKNVPFVAAYSSSLCRANETAKIIVESHSLSVHQDSRIVEIDFGDWEGKKLEEFISEDPQYWKEWCEDPQTTRAGKTGETAQQVFERMNEFVNEIVEMHPNETILITAHSWAIRLFVAGLLEMPFRNFRMIPQDNTGITIFEKTSEVLRFLAINLNTHLTSFD